MPVTDSVNAVALSPLVLDEELFDELCKKHGAETESARAELIGMERRNLSRWREGSVTPGLFTALRTAQTLETTVEALWKPRNQVRRTQRISEFA